MEFTNKESLCGPQPILFYYSKKNTVLFLLEWIKSLKLQSSKYLNVRVDKV